MKNNFIKLFIFVLIISLFFTLFNIASLANKKIKIGAIFAVTGPAAYLGAPEEKTAKMVVDQINKNGGVSGQQIELIIKDSGGSPEKAISFAKQLIEEDQVVAIIGPSTSGETMNIKNICEEAKTPLISCAAAEAIVNPLAKYVFKDPQNDSYVAKWIFQTMKDMGINKIGVVVSNTGFGNAGKEQLEKYAPDYGIKIVIKEIYDKSATDLTAVLTKIKANNVQALINWSIEPAQSIIAKNMKQLNMKIPLFQSHGFGNIKYVQAAGEAAEGIIFPCGKLLIAEYLPESNPQKKLLLKYRKDYKDEFKEDASTFGGHAYDALLILSKAIEDAKSLDRDKIRIAIENIKGLIGTAGIFNFSATDHNGLGMDSIEMIIVKNKKFTIYKK